MSTDQVNEFKHKIVPVLKKYGIQRAGLFGSVIRSDFSTTSDIDILAEVPEKYSLLDLIGIQDELSQVVGRSIDLVEYGAIKSIIKNKILSEEIRLYG
jgi:hypothetical protein